MLAAGIVLLAAGVRQAEAAPVADSPRAAVSYALRDATTGRLVHQAPTTRYVWVDSTDPWERAAHVLTVNHALSHSTLPVHPRWVKMPAGWIAAWELKFLADSKETLADLLKTWELLAEGERFFHQPCSGKFLVHSGGGRCRQVSANDKVMPALYLGDEGVALSQLLDSAAPIVRWDHFAVRVGSTLDHGYGSGLYTKFRRTEGLNLNQLLKTLGVNAFSERSVLLAESQVTGHNRRVRFFNSAATPVGTSGGVVYTEDTGDASTDDEDDVFRNLDNSKFDAIELFYSLPNGLQGTWLGDGKGQQQNQAPDSVATNHYAGSGTKGTRRLHAGFVSCGSCHVAESKSWYQPLKNDFLALSKELAVVDDKNLRVVQKYAFDPERIVLPAARESYFQAVDQLVQPYVSDEEDLTPRVWQTLAARFNSYVHDAIDLKQAVRELGLAEGTKRLEYPVFDPIVSLLNAGVAVKRWQFERVYADLALLDALGRGYSVTPYLGLEPRVPGGGFDRGPRVGLRERFDNHLVRELPINELLILAVPGEQVWNFDSDRRAWLLMGTVRQYGALRQQVSSTGGKFRYSVGLKGGKFREYTVQLKRGQGYELNFVK